MPLKKRFRFATTVYWMLLLYIIAALVWWFISLQRQNDQMKTLQEHQLAITMNTPANSQQYNSELKKIDAVYHRNLVKYIGEGIIFLFLMIVGAVYVYRYVRRQFLLQMQQQNFMMAITHELKTPISVARLNLETLQKYQLDTEKQKKLIRMTIDETERLNTLTNNILTASQLEGGGYIVTKEELDLSDLFKDCIRNFIHRYPDRKFIEFIETGMDVKGDALLLQLLINNLLENAIKYSPKKEDITCLLLKASNGRIELHVVDKGAGVSDKEKKNIFKKFYRIGHEANRKTQGTGLGLYLCKKIAEDHGADITVTNNVPYGSNFTVSFKKE
jgi:signal transduction histidine kinase